MLLSCAAGLGSLMKMTSTLDLPSRSSSFDFVKSVVERLNGKDFDVMRSTTVTGGFFASIVSACNDDIVGVLMQVDECLSQNNPTN